MSDIDYDAIEQVTDARFPNISFKLSCFDSIVDIFSKPVTFMHDSIIIVYDYRSEYYKHADIHLQDRDFIPVRKQDGQQRIRYCDVIDAIMEMEIKGELKPNHHLYMEGIVPVDDDNNRIPMYRIQWGN